jgi:hypothetical protein
LSFDVVSTPFFPLDLCQLGTSTKFKVAFSFRMRSFFNLQRTFRLCGSLAIITYQGTMHSINQTKKIFLSQIRTRRQVGAASLQSFVRAQSTDAQPKKRPIYVAATEQHVGKTTTCLALISGLKKRFPHSIGYMKPVGQQ